MKGNMEAQASSVLQNRDRRRPTAIDASMILPFAQRKRRSCQNRLLIKHIRTHTRRGPEYIPTTAPGGEVDEDAVLLPTTTRLRAAFQTDQHVADLEEFLSCNCTACAKARSLNWKQDTEDLARALCIPEADALRRSFAVLALAGCLFAFRIFYVRSRTLTVRDPVEFFLARLASQDGVEDRHRLFRSFVTEVSGESLDCVAREFEAAVRAKFWLIDIPKFYITDNYEPCSGKNLPFTVQKPILNGSSRRKSFFEIKLDQEYCDATELRDQRLFLKRLNIDRAYQDDVETESVNPMQDDFEVEYENAQQERKNLVEIKRRLQHAQRSGPPCIIQLLFAFDTTTADYRQVNMVFYYYENSLDDVLRASNNSLLPEGLQSSMKNRTEIAAHLPQHPLWLAALRLTETVADIHKSPSGRSRLGTEGKVGAHLDIKPNNIMIDQDRMLLIDFEHAFLGATDPSYNRVNEGQENYQPAEPHCADPETKSKRDVWSLGCVLLEILICICQSLHHPASVEDFRNQRRSESGPHQSGAFWYYHYATDSTVLKTCVKEQLRLLKRHGQHAKQIIDTVERMLQVDVDSRLTLEEALGELSAHPTLELSDFMPESFTQLIPAMGKMSTKFTTVQLRRKQIHHLFDGDLAFWRMRNAAGFFEVMLSLQHNDGARKLLIPKYACDRDVQFVPKSLYTHSGHSQRRPSVGVPFECEFRGLHDDVTFYFDVQRDYEWFQFAMTRQKPVHVSIDGVGDIDGSRLPFSLCTLNLSSTFTSQSITYTAGFAQIWYQWSDDEYQVMIQDYRTTPNEHSRLKSQGSSKNIDAFEKNASPAVSRSSETTHYRLAIFSSQPACVVFSSVSPSVDLYEEKVRADILKPVDCDFCRPDVSSRAHQNLAIFEGPKSFPLFRSTAASPELPGYPISPQVMKEQTSKGSASITNCKSVELAFATSTDFRRFASIITAKNLDTKRKQ